MQFWDDREESKARMDEKNVNGKKNNKKWETGHRVENHPTLTPKEKYILCE